ncbi:MAG: hypothetical protein ABRQ37_05290 [Candidatus Eremiobacterota bacterium]
MTRHECIEQILNEMDLFFIKDEDELFFIPNVRGINGTWNCIVYIEKNNVVVCSICDIQAKTENKKKITEYLARINYDLTFSRWDIELDDQGIITYKTFIHIPDGVKEETVNLIMGALFMINFQNFDTYFPGIAAINHGFISPRTAIKKIKKELIKEKELEEKELTDSAKQDLELLLQSLSISKK